MTSAFSDSVIRLENVSKEFGGGKSVRALRGITLSLRCGERVAVMGPSGSGKTSLLNLIAGLDAPTAGTIWIDGIELSAMSDDARTRLRREKIGMIFQTFNLLPTLSALDNVALPLRLQGLKRGEAKDRAQQMLERVSLGNRLSHLPDELSGGERQRVAIARALIFKPAIVLADEPTGNLDSVTGEEILDLLAGLHDEFNTTILLVTHNPLAAAHCDRLLTISDGVVTSDQPVAQSAIGVA